MVLVLLMAVPTAPLGEMLAMICMIRERSCLMILDGPVVLTPLAIAGSGIILKATLGTFVLAKLLCRSR
jgi:hypothetical protein